jgi:hypothetical protein
VVAVADLIAHSGELVGLCWLGWVGVDEWLWMGGRGWVIVDG